MIGRFFPCPGGTIIDTVPKESEIENPVAKWLQESWPAVLILAIGLLLISPLPELVLRSLLLRRAVPEQQTAPPVEPQLPSGWAEAVTLLDKFGEALIVAGVLALVYERRAKELVAKEVSRDAINHAVGWEVPPEVRETVKEIIRLQFERRGFVQHYRFDLAPVGSPRQHFAVISTTEYELTNLTNIEAAFDFRSSIEISTGRGLPENQLLLMKSPDEEFLGAKLDKLTQIDGPYRKAEKQIWIPARTKACFLTRRLAHYEPRGSLVLDILHPPAIGVKVTVEAPKDFVFRISFGIPGKVKESHEHPYWVWEHPGVFLAGSHFRLQWEPR